MKTKPIASMVLLILVINAAVYGDLHWEAAVSLQIPRQQTGVTLGHDDHIYAIGGVDEGYGVGHVTETVERFFAQTWSYVASMSVERYGHGAVTDSQGDIWAVAGGNLSSGWLDSVEVYDTSNDTWTPQTAHLNTARYNFGITIAADDSIYVYGGHGEGNVTLTSMEKYDPTAETWGTVTDYPMNEGRINPGFAVDCQGRFYAIGGETVDEILKTVERYDPANPELGWQYVADLPQVRSGPAAFTYDCEIWAVGGWEPNHLVNTCYIYTPDPDPNPDDPWPADSWREGPTMYENLVTARTAIGPTGIPYVIGGERAAGTPSDHVAILVPEPATLGLFLISCVALFRRRSR